MKNRPTKNEAAESGMEREDYERAFGLHAARQVFGPPEHDENDPDCECDDCCELVREFDGGAP